MGITFVLLFWGTALTCAAGLCAAGIWVWAGNRRSLDMGGPGSPVKAAILPFVLLVYGGGAFVGYWYWCEEVRHVDVGIGDSWQVPLGNGYFFCMLDVPDRGYVIQGGCSGGFVVADITQLAVTRDAIVGARDGRGFVFDTRSGGLREFPDAAQALAQVWPRPALTTPNWFYFQRRWSWADVVAVGTAGLGAALLLVVWTRRYVLPVVRPVRATTA